MYYTIYKITNLIDDKIYIGKHQTKDLNDGYFGSGKRLKYAIRKYGQENFSKEILFIFDNEEEMNLKEAELVTEEFCFRENTYNICVGGKGGWSYVNQSCGNQGERLNRALTYEKRSLGGKSAIKKTLNIVKQKRLEDPEYDRKFRENCSKNFKGKKHSQTAKDIIGKKNSIHQQGSKNSQYGTCWITNGTENKKIKKENLEEWISLGFYRGRIYN